MAISEEQLKTWSHAGSAARSASTYRSIKEALKSPGAPYARHRIDVFLQGSYGNDTNVRDSESDVDVVICLKDIQRSYPSVFGLKEQEVRRAAHIPATYGFGKFKSDVVSWLKASFDGVTPGKKAISVPGNGRRRDADVLACIEHRQYTSYRSPSDYQCHEGIVFGTSGADWIVNFPKQHRENCTSKHQATSNRFKQNVRVLKNMRNAMEDAHILQKGIAPSYFLEGMLWNVPDRYFVARYQQSFENYLGCLERCDANKLRCANGLHWLIRENSHVSWRMQDFRNFLKAARRYWNNSNW